MKVFARSARTLTQVTLPTAEQRSGVFLLHRVDGSTAPIPLQNPINGSKFYNGSITSNQMTQFSTAVLNALPANTVAVAGANGFGNNYISTPRGTVQDDKGDFRLDHKWNEKLSLFFRYSEHQATIIDPNSILGAAGGSQANGTVHIFNQQVAAGATYTINSNSLLDARVAYTWNEGGKTPYGLGQPSLLIANGITNGIPTDPAISRSLNGQAVSGFTAFGGQTSNPQFQNPFVIDPKVNYTLIHGNHSIKIGYEFQSHLNRHRRLQSSVWFGYVWRRLPRPSLLLTAQRDRFRPRPFHAHRPIPPRATRLPRRSRRPATLPTSCSAIAARTS